MSKPQYDKIAKAYEAGISQRLGRRFIFEPSLFDAIGNVDGLKVADFGCGTGDLTRKLHVRGAELVVGLDESSESIKRAQETTFSSHPHQIGYGIDDLSVKDAIKNKREMDLRNKFDLVVGGHIFHYSKTEEELRNMFQNAADALKPAGRLVAINNNPQNPLTENTQYGEAARLIDSERGLVNGVQIQNTLYSPEGIACQFKTFHWDKPTYESAIQKAGFKDIKWTIPKVSEEGIKRFGKEFWEPWYANPFLTILEARK